jgi:AraC-like DNA-binding protein
MAISAKEPPLQLGGHLEKPRQELHAWLHSANSGTTHFQETRWWRSCWKWWVIDVTHSDQPQRINGGSEFVRPAGVVALYRPGLRFEEWQERGQSAHESWILFTAAGPMRRALNAITGSPGYCHFLDPEAIVRRSIMQISRDLSQRYLGFELRAQGSFLNLLSAVTSARPSEPQQRLIQSTHDGSPKPDLQRKVEAHVRSRISEIPSVGDLAGHVGLGLSTFAHTYRRLTGETPHQTVVRIKMEAAKRLLIQNGFSVKETAARLGYSSEFQFSRCFKRMEGRSPLAHVRAMTEKGVPNPRVRSQKK